MTAGTAGYSNTLVEMQPLCSRVSISYVPVPEGTSETAGKRCIIIHAEQERGLEV